MSILAGLKCIIGYKSNEKNPPSIQIHPTAIIDEGAALVKTARYGIGLIFQVVQKLETIVVWDKMCLLQIMSRLKQREDTKQ